MILSTIISRLNDVPIIGQYVPQIMTFFDGVNIKTVLLCIVGMSVVMKLNSNNAVVQQPPVAAVGGIDAQVSRAAAINVGEGLDVNGSPGLRGAVGESIETDDTEEVGMTTGSIGGEEAVASSEGQPPPPPPPVSSTTEGQQTTVGGTMYQQPAAYATPDGGTMTQQQQQAGSYAVPIGSTISQSPLQDAQSLLQQTQPGAYGETGALGSATTLTNQPPPVSSGVDTNNQPIPLSSAPLNQMQMAIPPAVAAITGDGSGMLAQHDPNQPIGGVTTQQGGLPPDVMGSGSGSSVPLVPEAPAMPISDAVQVPEAVPVAEAAPVPSVEGSLLPLLSNFKDSWDPYEPTDIPMFWHSKFYSC